MASVTASRSETNQTICAAIAPAMLQASDTSSQMFAAMSSLDYNSVAGEFSGEEAAALRRLAVSQAALAPFYLDFLANLENTALLMRNCSR